MAILVPICDKYSPFALLPRKKLSPGNRLAICLAFISLLLSTVSIAHAQKDNYTEYEVKAAFMYQFIAFINWPPESFKDDTTPFTIGVLGKDPFEEILDNMIKNKKAHNRTIKIMRSEKPEDLKQCHIVFVCSSEQENADTVLDTLSTSSTLTIGEWDSFTKQGGIIRFMLRKNKIAFEINNDNAQNAGLKISSQLLNLAQVTDDNKERSS